MKPKTDPMNLLQAQEAAAYLTISVRTLRALTARGSLLPVRVSPGRVAFDRRELDAYIERQRAR